MSEYRAYLDPKGLEIKKRPKGMHYLEIQVGNAIIEQILGTECGEFFIRLNTIDPRIPRALRGRVTRVTYSENFRIDQVLSTKMRSVPEGNFRSRSGKAQAEITRTHFGNVQMPYMVVKMRARSLRALLALRKVLLFENKTQTIEAA